MLYHECSQFGYKTRKLAREGYAKHQSNHNGVNGWKFVKGKVWHLKEVVGFESAEVPTWGFYCQYEKKDIN